jgi:hypothetical protein
MVLGVRVLVLACPMCTLGGVAPLLQCSASSTAPALDPVDRQRPATSAYLAFTGPGSSRVLLRISWSPTSATTRCTSSAWLAECTWGTWLHQAPSPGPGVWRQGAPSLPLQRGGTTPRPGRCTCLRAAGPAGPPCECSTAAFMGHAAMLGPAGTCTGPAACGSPVNRSDGSGLVVGNLSRTLATPG